MAEIIHFNKQVSKHKAEDLINYRINDVYFGEDFHFCKKTGKVTKLPPHKIVMGYFVFDAKNKRLLDPANTDDGFIPAFLEEIKGKKVNVESRGHHKYVIVNGVCIVKCTAGKIVYVNLPTIQQIDDHFLSKDTYVTYMSARRAKTVGVDFMRRNACLKNLILTQALAIGEDALAYHSSDLYHLDLSSMDKGQRDNVFYFANNMADMKPAYFNYLTKSTVR